MATARLGGTTFDGAAQNTVGATTITAVSVDLNAPGICGSIDNSVIHVIGVLVGFNSATGKGVTSQVTRAYSRVSGTLTALGSGIVSIVPMQGDATLLTSVSGLTSSGTIIQLQVTGIALLTIAWTGYITLYSSDFTG